MRFCGSRLWNKTVCKSLQSRNFISILRFLWFVAVSNKLKLIILPGMCGMATTTLNRLKPQNFQRKTCIILTNIGQHQPISANSNINSYIYNYIYSTYILVLPLKHLKPKSNCACSTCGAGAAGAAAGALAALTSPVSAGMALPSFAAASESQAFSALVHLCTVRLRCFKESRKNNEKHLSLPIQTCIFAGIILLQPRTRSL